MKKTIEGLTKLLNPKNINQVFINYNKNKQKNIQ